MYLKEEIRDTKMEKKRRRRVNDDNKKNGNVKETSESTFKSRWMTPRSCMWLMADTI